MSDAPDVDNELLAKLEDGVLWLTINRVEAGNAIPFYVRDRLIQHFVDAHTNLEVRAVVITGAGEKHFCTGADLRVRPTPKPKPEGAPDMVTGDAVNTMRAGFQRLMEAIQDCQKPVLCALNGTAAGGGVMLALASDLIVAVDTARLIHVFVRRGLIPDGGVAYLLPRLVGLHKAKELVFFGDDLSATEAERIGIVNKVVAGAEFATMVNEWATRLAKGPTKAIGWSKQLLNAALEVDRTTMLVTEGMLVEMNAHTLDGKEGVASFMEKRPTEFKGW
ncbi:MAG: 2-(1,2-epoxy,2-dihydrophenyl)acetyl-CoA isomerase [Actinomycetota bacterium]|nr:2-(1,2-epoxy,2-dihydrophenyl)acetyl-CoA isomerase [Actinomycetota bacterium]